DSNNLSDSQLQTLSSAIDNLERLTRLNKSLLLLTKIENRQFSDETNVNIGELCQKLITDFSEQAAYLNIALTLEEQCPCIRKMNPDLAVILFTNLIKNAL